MANCFDEIGSDWIRYVHKHNRNARGGILDVSSCAAHADNHVRRKFYKFGRHGLKEFGFLVWKSVQELNFYASITEDLEPLNQRLKVGRLLVHVSRVPKH